MTTDRLLAPHGPERLGSVGFDEDHPCLSPWASDRFHSSLTRMWPSAAVFAMTAPASTLSRIPNSTSTSSGSSGFLRSVSSVAWAAFRMWEHCGIERLHRMGDRSISSRRKRESRFVVTYFDDHRHAIRGLEGHEFGHIASFSVDGGRVDVLLAIAVAVARAGPLGRIRQPSAQTRSFGYLEVVEDHQ
jgi:hypothetical protein